MQPSFRTNHSAKGIQPSSRANQKAPTDSPKLASMSGKVRVSLPSVTSMIDALALPLTSVRSTRTSPVKVIIISLRFTLPLRVAGSVVSATRGGILKFYLGSSRGGRSAERIHRANAVALQQFAGVGTIRFAHKNIIHTDCWCPRKRQSCS